MFKRWLLILLVVPMLIAPVQAGIFGRKKEKIDPKTRVAELITILKSDPNPDQRTRAAEELRNFDAAVFPDIIPALVAALKSDTKSSVRIEAAQSLGRIRPVNQSAGEALEQAVAADSAMRVRLQARSALMQYHWAGYRNGKKTEVPPLTPSREPPLANGEKTPPIIRTTPATGGSPYPLVLPNPSRGPTTKEPPLAPVELSPKPDLRPVPAVSAPMPPPIQTTPPTPTPSSPAPLPSGPDLSRSTPVSPPLPPPVASSPATLGAGPELP